MKLLSRVPPILLAVLIVACNDTREPEVRRALQAFAHCWDARDVICMDKLLSNDFTYVFRSGQEADRTAFLAAIKDAKNLSAGSEVPHDAVITFYGAVAVARFAGGTPVTHLTMIWSNTDGKGWHLVRGQSTVRAATTFASANDLASALRRAEAAHAEHEKRIGKRDENWPDWYAGYMISEQAGKELPQ